MMGGGGGVWSGGKHVTWDMLTCTAKRAAEFAVSLALRVLSDLYVRGEWSQSECMAVFAQIMSLLAEGCGKNIPLYLSLPPTKTLVNKTVMNQRQLGKVKKKTETELKKKPQKRKFCSPACYN
ncbi:hypothetical protein ACE6H2_019287 [Prunus campanulata]